MKLDSATVRRLIPAGAVIGVLAVSYVAQAPSLASNNDVGYGYANNCGVKGDGFHDHGKPCPNRPFPGHGNGVQEILGTTTSGSTSTSSKSKENSHSQVNVTSSATSGTGASDDGDNSTNSGKSHGHRHSKGHGQGRASA